jgi:hypothetical protein
MLWLFCLSAFAGTVVVSTTVPVEVRLDSVPIVQTFGASDVTLPNIAAGRKVFTVYRDGKPMPIAIEVPEGDGIVRIRVGAESLDSDKPSIVAKEGEPTLELRAANGQKFGVVLDGKRTAVVSFHQALKIETLGVGEHTIEVRTPDNLTVWIKGTLDLELGDAIVLTLQEGRMAEVFGRAQAWIPMK